VSYLFHEAWIIPLTNFQMLLNYLLFKNYVVICGLENIFNKEIKKENVYVIYHRQYRNFILRAARFAFSQIEISFSLLYLIGNIDVCIFFMDGGIILPIIVAKCLGKKVVWMIPSSFIKIDKLEKDMLSPLLIFTQKLSYKIVDKILIYSPLLNEEYGLNEFSNKILIAHHHVIDLQKFRSYQSVINRRHVVGFIGRLNTEKGIMNFVQAIPLIINKMADIEFFIVGDGPLKNDVIDFLHKNSINEKVKMNEWIPRDNLPRILNYLSLLVLPSYTEGLPNIMLEAMGCCTPVLATPVGAIPDIIKDGETGFIIKDNSPEIIAAGVIRALENPDLDGIAIRARETVERFFSLEKTAEKLSLVLEEI